MVTDNQQGWMNGLTMQQKNSKKNPEFIHTDRTLLISILIIFVYEMCPENA